MKYADILWNRTLVLLEDKLSSTTVDFIRSEGKLKLSAYIRFGSLRSVKVLKLMIIRSLRSAKSVKPNGNWKPKKFKKVLNLIGWKMWKVLIVCLRSGRVLGN